MKTKSIKPFLLLLIGSFLFSACSDGFEDPIIPGGQNGGTNTGTTTFGIRHDKTLADYNLIATNQSPFNTDEHPDFSPVITFSYSLDGSNSDDYIATGTLVDPYWILTAGHNFFVAEEQNAPAPAAGIQIFIGNDPNNPDATRGVESLVFHPTWISENEDFIKGNDLCLVRLSSPINNITPALINFDMNEEIGGTTWYAGFGDYSQEAGQNPNLFSKKHAVENILDRKVEGISSGNGTYFGGLLAFDFDDPASTINSLGDTYMNEDEILLGDGVSDAIATEYEGTTVQGDSGGPLFCRTGNAWRVCGVLSGGAGEPIPNHKDSSYGDISVFIRVSSHKDWIQSVVF